MQIIRRREELALALDDLRSEGLGLALVPTMGALHAGHLSLIEEAKTRADRVMATIFVNPLQFNDASDLDRYPRDEESDLAMLEAAGCDFAWLPDRNDIYPDGFATTISITGVSDRWEGKHRPGHFDGVATVVAKLLIAVAPDIAIFGEKDFQQLAVIRRLVADLGLPVTIVGVPTVRDADGLALSSRNALLTDDERRRARTLPRALSDACHAILGGERVEGALAAAKAALADAGFSTVDYVALVDADTLEPLAQPCEAMRLIAAATIGTTRLIDNLPIRKS